MIPIPFDYKPFIDDDKQDREWWRWHFAGRIAGGLAADSNVQDISAVHIVKFADLLIAQLEKEKGES